VAILSSGADPLVSVRLSCRIAMLPLTRRFQYMWCLCLWTGADPSVCIRVRTCPHAEAPHTVSELTFASRVREWPVGGAIPITDPPNGTNHLIYERDIR
jgi:hypothetical protein